MPDDCKHEAGIFAPVIDPNSCEGKQDCVSACPYDVFEMGVISVEQRKKLSWIGWAKALAHGGKQAFAVRAEDCHACGLCVTACPENAIRLARR